MNENNLLSYWKKSLSDSLKSDIDISKCEHFCIQNFELGNNLVANLQEVNKLFDSEEKRINNSKGITLNNNRNWQNINTIQILISPFYLNPIPEHQVLTGDTLKKLPFWFYAKIKRNGELLFPEEFFPVIQRRFLEPLADERTSFIFSSMETVDSATSVSFTEISNYLEFIGYVSSVFEYITKQPLNDYKANGYSTIFDATIILPNEEIGAAKTIVDLYQKILVQNRIDPTFKFSLLTKFISLDLAQTKSPLNVSDFMKYNAKYLGQMGFNFPLSISQRMAITTLNEKKQIVFAINGPPGTGKTTLLQSIVANEMVKSAIIGNQPTMMLACSNNNQAVTNIIDSFSKSNTKAGLLQGRWLPDIDGYATYLPRSGIAAEELTGINFNKLNGDGIFARVESYEYLENAKGVFLAKASKYLSISSEHNSINKSIERLREEIISLKTNFESVPQKWQRYVSAEEQFLSSYLSDQIDKNKYYSNNMLFIQKFEEDINQLVALEQNINRYFDQEPFSRKLFCFLNFSSAQQSRVEFIKILLRDSTMHIPENTVKINRGKILLLINKKINKAKEIINGISVWYEWKVTNNINGNPPQTDKEYWIFEYRKIEQNEKPNCFYDELDVTLRHKAFQLALHYWEGRWIIETENKGVENHGEIASKRRWLRRAMLTPCFVSTFYMAPKFFAYSKHLGLNDVGGTIWGDGSLFNFVDLLIVDEAGQVTPEVGVATFSLAKKAIVVGDIKQIEPIWNITKPIDLGNLKSCFLIKDYADKTFENVYELKGFLSSSGSIMKMAQNACDYKDDRLSEKGVILLEHRRCYNEIIEYCNRLAYNGILKPLKGNAPSGNIFRPMVLIDVQGSSVKKNNSRSNQEEVVAILKWLVDNKVKILNKYGEVEQNIGIITPFVEQKLLLKRKLHQAGFDTDALKIGTVHALQGAERSIVLFSMVYGPNEVATMFFDQRPNMLNVAVSRAKDSFIVFANKQILNKESNSPSGILANYIK